MAISRKIVGLIFIVFSAKSGRALANPHEGLKTDLHIENSETQLYRKKMYLGNLCDDSVKASPTPGVVARVSVYLHPRTRNVEALIER